MEAAEGQAISLARVAALSGGWGGLGASHLHTVLFVVTALGSPGRSLGQATTLQLFVVTALWSQALVVPPTSFSPLPSTPPRPSRAPSFQIQCL